MNTLDYINQNLDAIFREMEQLTPDEQLYVYKRMLGKMDNKIIYADYLTIYDIDNTMSSAIYELPESIKQYYLAKPKSQTLNAVMGEIHTNCYFDYNKLHQDVYDTLIIDYNDTQTALQ